MFKFEIWALSSSGRATDLHSVGKEFDSPRVHKMWENAAQKAAFVISKTKNVSLGLVTISDSKSFIIYYEKISA